MKAQAMWKGTYLELRELLKVIDRNCACVHAAQPQARCPAHGMLGEQRVIDGLVFAHRFVDKFVIEEFAPNSGRSITHLGPV